MPSIQSGARAAHEGSRGRRCIAVLLLAVLMPLAGCASGTPVGLRVAASGLRYRPATPPTLPREQPVRVVAPLEDGSGTDEGESTVGVPTVRLEMGEGEPRVFTPPALPAVQVEEVELREALARLVLELRLLVRTPPPGPPVLLASAGDVGRVDWAFQRTLRWGLWCQPGQSPQEDGCLSLLERGLSLGECERVHLALGFALDTVWEGAVAGLRESFDAKVLWAMVGGFAVSYVLMLAAPEPVFTKGVALALTAYMVAYLGVGPFWELVKASRNVVEASRRAVTFAELEEAGHRFGRRLGENGARVVILLMTAALGGQQGLAARGATLPGFGWATWLSATQLRLPVLALESVRSIQLTASGGLVIGVAPTAMAMAAQGMGGEQHSVYISLGDTGHVQYVGITNDLARRSAEHLRQNGFRIRELLEDLSREDARAVEQALIEIHGLAKNGGTLLNRINSIAHSNPKYAAMVRRGRELLESIGYRVE